jgi:hypothetical protein
MPLHERVRGVNLSGWLVLESWVTPGVFAASGALDERDLVRSLGHDRYRLLVDRHRENFIQEQDFKAIAARGYNAVRIKVPWFLLGDDGPAPGDYVGCAEYVDKAMEWADACVLVLPCGRSAHTEAGWFAGKGIKTVVYIPEKQEPELMYKLFDAVVDSIDGILDILAR